MFEIPKMIFIYGVGFSIGCLFLIDILVSKRKIIFNRIHLFVAIFLVSQIVSFVFSIDLHTSWYGYYGRLNGGVLSTIVFCIFLLVGTNIFDQKSFRKLMIVSIFASFMVFLWGAPGRLLGVDTACIYFRQDFSTSCWTNEFRPAERMFATLGQPNWLGTYFVAHVFIGLFVLLTPRNKKPIFDKLGIFTKSNAGTFALIAYFFAMTAGIYFTGSRSALLALAVPFVIELFVWLKKVVSKNVFRLTILLALTMMVLVSSFYAFALVGNGKENDDITHSGKIRLIVWEGAIKLAQRYPIFGTGPETFAYSYFLTRPESHNNTSERDFIYNKAHNELLNMLANTGVVGLLAYTTLLGYALYLFWNSDLNGRLLGYVIVVTSICNTFGFSTSTSQLILYVVMSASVYMSEKKSKILEIDPSLVLKYAFFKWVVITSIVLTWFLLSLFTWRYWQADLHYSNAMSYFESRDPVRAIASCARALDYKFEHLYADKCASIFGSTASLLSDTKSPELVEYREELISQANSLSLIAIHASPRNPIYVKSRIRLLRVLSTVDKERSVKYSTEIAKLRKTHSILAPTDHSLQK